MEISPTLLSSLLCYSFLFGAMIGALNDVFRILRIFLAGGKNGEELPKSSKIIIGSVCFLEDLVLVLASAFGIIVLCYHFNYGSIRLFSPVFALLGAVIWYFSLGKIIMIITMPVVRFIIFVIEMSAKILITPIRRFVTLLINLITYVAIIIKKDIANKRNILYNKKVSKWYLKQSYSGFMLVKK